MVRRTDSNFSKDMLLNRDIISKFYFCSFSLLKKLSPLVYITNLYNQNIYQTYYIQLCMRLFGFVLPRDALCYNNHSHEGIQFCASIEIIFCPIYLLIDQFSRDQSYILRGHTHGLGANSKQQQHPPPPLNYQYGGKVRLVFVKGFG